MEIELPHLVLFCIAIPCEVACYWYMHSETLLQNVTRSNFEPVQYLHPQGEWHERIIQTMPFPSPSPHYTLLSPDSSR